MHWSAQPFRVPQPWRAVVFLRVSTWAGKLESVANEIGKATKAATTPLWIFVRHRPLAIDALNNNNQPSLSELRGPRWFTQEA